MIGYYGAHEREEKYIQCIQILVGNFKERDSMRDLSMDVDYITVDAEDIGCENVDRIYL
jgi:hypothetical protein